ncbi:hypothetical protein [Paenibacillus sp. VTT E-133291]|uniref:hypothetical protein n=1 Tax=Paenibacillus sp. VTT E-133291 TaxID=1986223 RepID=UPI0015C67CF5|nr:hypothetical protein [Paenibacillus sp. VTT E-133291]
MNEKFQAVIEKHNEQPFVFGDDKMIQSILEEKKIVIEVLPHLATYLDQEYKLETY